MLACGPKPAERTRPGRLAGQKDRGRCGGGAAIACARVYRYQWAFPAAGRKIERTAPKILAATSQKKPGCV
jgi:hypothetical protein